MNKIKDLLYCSAACNNSECWQNLSMMDATFDKSIMVADLSEGCEQLEPENQ